MRRKYGDGIDVGMPMCRACVWADKKNITINRNVSVRTNRNGVKVCGSKPELRCSGLRLDESYCREINRRQTAGQTGGVTADALIRKNLAAMAYEQ